MKFRNGWETKEKRKEMNAGFKPNNYFRVLCHPVRNG